AGNVRDDRLGDVVLDERSRGLFVAAPNLTDEDDAFGLRITLEELEHIDEVHAAHRIAANAHARALAELRVRGLKHCLVREGAGARNNADRTLLVDEARHDADLAFVGGDDAGAVRPDEPRAGPRQGGLHAHHVVHRHAFRDAHDELDTGIRRFEDGIRSAGRRHIDHAGRRAGLARRFLHRIEDGLPNVRFAAAPGCDAAHDLRAVREALFGVIGALLARESLAQDARVPIDQDAHFLPFALPAMATTVRAASVRSAAAVMVSPLPASISRAFGAFVPSSRTTTGTCTPTFLTAVMMPSAMMSQRTMPPKMFTRIARTFLFDRMSSNATVTRSAVAPPPTSRKFAGAPPCSLMRSMVAMARPAPFTMQAMSPSSET